MSHSTQETLVRLDSVTKSYDGDRTIIDNLSLAIYDGEFVTLLGPSGCGKTTVLRLIAGLEECSAGRILLGGQEITHLGPEQRNVNTVFQSYALFPHMTVYDNVAFGLRTAKVPEGEIKPRVIEALKMVQLDAMASRKPDQLSGGQQQRIAIARAVVNRPKVLLLDESLSALDYKLRKQMQIELKQLQRKLGITFIFVTHDQEEALSMSDRILVMREGEVVQTGTPKEIYETPASRFVAEFIGESNLFAAEVLEPMKERHYRCDISGKIYPVYSEKPLQLGSKINVLLRPEDLRLEEIPADGDSEFLTGTVTERTYKGMTLDSVIALDNGQQIQVSEFFNEDDPDVDHSLGQRVAVTWVPSWEVVLPYDGQ
ncbi:spermidine/putrescine ABC transporter ATP-binding protein PotA [Ferrimonas sediminicola]|uniref:Spermidine/putrescine import ATP-binding protein PotA n=1 Tax=Ferrimonas sediminicola TaxID=2569538 RepID=A0A4U1BGP4_9GAMM|nr:spermidine/putrescine ABC transporter ATP-binding protein PotA [Ferrimonas sediminicola]TKB50512.1 spermidine/putrescine ABC transporter ATP-binding protein PotA [Ferrimonas sediminicola]